MRPILEYHKVSYEVGGRRVLEDIELSVHEGETLILLGRSGSGKTTLLRMALALIHPSSGEVRFEGRPLTEWDPIRLRRRMGYVIQDAGLFPHRTVASNVGLVPRLEGWESARIRVRVDTLLEEVGLPALEYGDRLPRELSGGQRQRVGIARALAAEPPVLLLDEPFGALDPVTRLDLQRQFIRLRDEYRKTTIFVTHDVREALAIGSSVALLHEGRVEYYGPATEFRSAGTAEARAFLECLSEPRV